VQITVRILLLASAFNGLTQRLWEELRAREHDVAVALYTGADDVIAATHAAQPQLVLCPYLNERVPELIWRRWPTVIIHPGPVGDQGPSSLDRAILDNEPVWGVTALEAVEEFDTGPIWAYRTFPMPADPPRKSSLYAGPVTEAAVECAVEVVEHAADPAFRPTPLRDACRPVPGTRRRPLLKQADRRFDWAADAADIVRRIRAADGYPGVRTVLAGQEVNVFDARLGTGVGTPGQVIGRHRGHLLVAAGQGAVWVGQLKRAGGLKLPAATVLPVPVVSVDHVPELSGGPREIRYRRRGSVGELTFCFYNGAAGVDQCLRLESALRYAAKQDTHVIVLRSGPDVFCNGVHLGEIEAAADPATAAWHNIRAINRACRALIEVSDQITIAAYTGPAGAGGVMLGLGADVVVGRGGVILNPYYDIGLSGSELHTLTLPHRVGREGAATLLSAKMPISTNRAADIGLIDFAGPPDRVEFDEWLRALAHRYTDPAAWRGVIYSRVPADRPLDYFESQELADMARDVYDDRSGFAAARRAFLYKQRPVLDAHGMLITDARTSYDDFVETMALAGTWVRTATASLGAR
jgi:putative two-component system protein, hydrogenase maturation factor HypX/HoxX